MDRHTLAPQHPQHPQQTMDKGVDSVSMTVHPDTQTQSDTASSVIGTDYGIHATHAAAVEVGA